MQMREHQDHPSQKRQNNEEVEKKPDGYTSWHDVYSQGDETLHSSQ